MSVSASKSRSFYKNKYLEYRRKYKQAKTFSSKLETTQAKKTAQSKGSEKAGSAKAMEEAQQKQSVDASAAQSHSEELKTQNTQTQNTTAKHAQFNDQHRSRMQRKLAQYKPYIKAAAARYDLPEELIAGVIWQESRANPRAVSHCGAMGLMQLMPGTARNLGVRNAFHPGQNIDGGAKYLRQMLDKFGKVEYAVAAYNAGPGNVKKYGGIPPFRETRAYVPKVLGGARAFKGAGGFQDQGQAPTAVRV